MNDTFKNVVFVTCVVSCLLVTGLSSYTAQYNQQLFDRVFSSLAAEQNNQQVLSVAQEYAARLAIIAEYQTTRAHELEQSLIQFQGLAIRDEMNTAIIKASEVYIEQLTQALEENDIEVPEIDLERVLGCDTHCPVRVPEE